MSDLGKVHLNTLHRSDAVDGNTKLGEKVDSEYKLTNISPSSPPPSLFHVENTDQEGDSESLCLLKTASVCVVGLLLGSAFAVIAISGIAAAEVLFFIGFAMTLTVLLLITCLITCSLEDTGEYSATRWGEGGTSDEDLYYL